MEACEVIRGPDVSQLELAKPLPHQGKDDLGEVSVTVSVKEVALREGIIARLRGILEAARREQQAGGVLQEPEESTGAGTVSNDSSTIQSDVSCDQSRGSEDALGQQRRLWAVHNHEAQLIDALREIESLDMAIAWAKGADVSHQPDSEAAEALLILTRAMRQQLETVQPTQSSVAQTDGLPVQKISMELSAETTPVGDLSRSLDNSPPTKQSPVQAHNMEDVQRSLDESFDSLTDIASPDLQSFYESGNPGQLTDTESEAEELESTLVLSEGSPPLVSDAADESLHLELPPQLPEAAATPGKASIAATESWEPALKSSLASRQKMALLKTAANPKKSPPGRESGPAWGGGHGTPGRKSIPKVPAGLSYVAMITELASQIAKPPLPENAGAPELQAAAGPSESPARGSVAAIGPVEPEAITKSEPHAGGPVTIAKSVEPEATTADLPPAENKIDAEAATETEAEIEHPLRPGMTTSLEAFLRSHQQGKQRHRQHKDQKDQKAQTAQKEQPLQSESAEEANRAKKLRTHDHLRIPAPKWVPSLDMLRVSTRGADSYQELFHVRQEGRARLALLRRDYAEGQHTRHRVEERQGRMTGIDPTYGCAEGGAISSASVSPPVTARSRCYPAQPPASAPPLMFRVPTVPSPIVNDDESLKSCGKHRSKPPHLPDTGPGHGYGLRHHSVSPYHLRSQVTSETAATVSDFSPISPRRLHVSPAGGKEARGSLLSPKQSPRTGVWGAPVSLEQICGEEVFSLVRQSHSQALRDTFCRWKRLCGWHNLASVILHEVRLAREDVAGTSKSDLSALHCFTNPPKTVRRALEALAVVLSHGEGPNSWANVLSLLRSDRLKAQLLMFKPKELQPQVVKRLQEDYLDRPDFSCAEVSRASHALGPVLRWIKAMVSYGVYHGMLLQQDQAPREDLWDSLRREGPPNTLSGPDVSQEQCLDRWRRLTVLRY